MNIKDFEARKEETKNKNFRMSTDMTDKLEYITRANGAKSESQMLRCLIEQEYRLIRDAERKQASEKKKPS